MAGAARKRRGRLWRTWAPMEPSVSRGPSRVLLKSAHRGHRQRRQDFFLALADVATRTTISAGVAVNARQRLLPITRLPFYRAG